MLKYIIATFSIVVVCLGMISCTQQEEQKQRTKWEYKIESTQSPKELLDSLGEEGWELVAVPTIIDTDHSRDLTINGEWETKTSVKTSGVYFILKRPK